MFSLCNICSYYLVINSKLVNALCIIMSWAKDNLINIIFISIECFTSSPLKHGTLWIVFNSSFFSPSQQSRENRHPPPVVNIDTSHLCLASVWWLIWVPWPRNLIFRNLSFPSRTIKIMFPNWGSICLFFGHVSVKLLLCAMHSARW